MVAPETLLALFDQGRPADPSPPLMELPGGGAVTYGDAERRGAQLANALAAHGVRAGDRVLVQIEKSPTLLLLYLACLRAGAVFLPLNPSYSDAEVAYLVADAEPALAVCDPGRVQAYGAVPVLTADLVGDGTLDAAASSCDDAFKDADVTGSDPAALLYTSGTTGRPKGALLSHGNLTANALALHQAWGFGPDDVLLHALPLYHAHGLFVAAHCALANGTGMVFCPAFDVDVRVGALGSLHRVHGGPDLLHPAARAIPASTAKAAATSGSSCPARLPCWRAPTASSSNKPVTPSSSATA